MEISLNIKMLKQPYQKKDEYEINKYKTINIK